MNTDLCTRIAKLLLLEKGELSRSDLASLPWVNNDDNEIDLIMSILLRSMDTKIVQRKIESSFPEWEDYIVLLSKPKSSLVRI
jgi:hypothetical protein